MVVATGSALLMARSDIKYKIYQVSRLLLLRMQVNDLACSKYKIKDIISVRLPTSLLSRSLNRTGAGHLQ